MTSPSDTSGGRKLLLVTGVFAVLTIAATWPQAITPAGIPPHRDAWFNMWRLAWVARQIIRDPIHLFDANIHYPERGTLAYSDALLLEGFLGAPLLWVGLPTPHVHTILVLGSFVFAGVATWALVRRLTGSNLAGVVGGIILAFAPYRFDHYMHLELLWTGWMPLALLAAHRTLEDGRVRAGFAAGLLTAAQTLSGIYIGIFFGTVLIPMLLVLAVGLPWLRLRRAALGLGGGGLLAAAILLAYVMPYWQARGSVGERADGEVQLYSAGPIHYLAATPGNLLYGHAADRLGRHEKRLFPGLVATVLAFVAVWPPLTRHRVALVVGLVVAVDLSFGPNGLVFDWLREHAAPYRGLRAPARAGGVALLMVAVLAGIGWHRLSRAAVSYSARARRSAGALVLSAMALEYVNVPLDLVPAPTRPEAVDVWLASRSQAVVLELPLPDEHALPLHDAEFAYRSTFHWHRLVNGYSGNVPDSYVRVLRTMRDFPGGRAIDHLRGLGVTYIVLHERLFDPARLEAIRGTLDARPDLIRHGPFESAGDRSTVYQLR